ncbi:MAG TPA: Ig-like domain-containing protein [Steroidobacteraceae bacterium]|nr:Ig-like domain-containing protein [Steroidobacteraceae bacterium]
MKRIASALAAMILTTDAQAATFNFRSVDDPGEGFNDPAPFTPSGGNTATTLGAARMNLMREAGRIWGAILQSNVTIEVDVEFSDLTCTSNSGTLGQAGAALYFSNFPGAPLSNVAYPSALADSLAGSNRSSNPTSADISAELNSAVDSSPTCLGGRGFYYGFDHNRGMRSDLLNVVLHEIGHGLGFASAVDETTGDSYFPSGRFAAYDHQLYDETQGKNWPAMSAAERAQSATNNGNLGWLGTSANAQAGRFSIASRTLNGRLRMYAPTIISGGSSISHWDITLTPDALMEPNLRPVTIGAVDITACALQDIGWRVNRCPDDQVVNTRPIANSQTVSVAEESTILITLTGTDAESDPLSFAITRAPISGTITGISTTTPRTVTYTPFANYSGPDSFQFGVSDGALASTPATVAITVTPVNDPPVANPQLSTTQTGQAVSILLLGADADTDLLTYTVLTSPSSGTLSGTVPSLVYLPNSGFDGTDTFTYRVNDGTVDSAAAAVTITVSAPPATSTAASSGGGGGATSELLLAMLMGIEFVRRLTRRASSHRQ